MTDVLGDRVLLIAGAIVIVVVSVVGALSWSTRSHAAGLGVSTQTVTVDVIGAVGP